MGIKIKYGGFAWLVDEATGRPVGFRDERDASEHYFPTFNTALNSLRKPDGSTASLGSGSGDSGIPTVDNVVRTGGFITSLREEGVTYTLGRDANGGITTVTANGVTKTLLRDADGNFNGLV